MNTLSIQENKYGNQILVYMTSDKNNIYFELVCVMDKINSKYELDGE